MKILNNKGLILILLVMSSLNIACTPGMHENGLNQNSSTDSHGLSLDKPTDKQPDNTKADDQTTKKVENTSVDFDPSKPRVYKPDYLNLLRASDAEDVKHFTGIIAYQIDPETGNKEYIVGADVGIGKKIINVKFSDKLGVNCSSVSECLNQKLAPRHHDAEDAYTMPLFISSHIYAGYEVPEKVLVHLPRFNQKDKDALQLPDKRNINVDNINITFYETDLRYDETNKKFDIESTIQNQIISLYTVLSGTKKKSGVERQDFTFVPGSVIEYINTDTYNICVNFDANTDITTEIYRDRSVTKNKGKKTVVSDMSQCKGINTNTTLVVYHKQR